MKITRRVIVLSYVIFLVLVCITMLAVATVMYFQYGQQYEDFIERELVWSNLFLLSFGIILAMVLFVGYLGFLKAIPLIITIYAACLLFIGLCLLILGLVTLILRGRIAEEVSDNGERIFGDYNDSMRLVDQVQIKLRCCGFLNAEELNDNDTYPESCCGHMSQPPTIGKMCLNPYPYGCKDLIIGIVKYPLSVVGSLSIAASILLFFGVGFAAYDVMMLKAERR